MSNPDSSNDFILRRSPAALINELRIPAEAISRSLQRLGLSQLAPVGMPAPPAALLIKRARALSSELSAIIEELISLAGPIDSEGPVARLRQDRLPVRLLVIEAVDALELDDRTSIEGPSELAINTHVPRLQEILTNLLAVARQRSAAGQLTVAISTIGLAVAIEVSWRDARPERLALDDPETGIPHLRNLAASLGGRLETVTDDGRLGLRVLLPQQRAQDRDETAIPR